jgi:hypothetical protein
MNVFQPSMKLADVPKLVLSYAILPMLAVPCTLNLELGNQGLWPGLKLSYPLLPVYETELFEESSLFLGYMPYCC